MRSVGTLNLQNLLSRSFAAFKLRGHTWKSSDDADFDIREMLHDLHFDIWEALHQLHLAAVVRCMLNDDYLQIREVFYYLHLQVGEVLHDLDFAIQRNSFAILDNEAVILCPHSDGQECQNDSKDPTHSNFSFPTAKVQLFFDMCKYFDKMFAFLNLFQRNTKGINNNRAYASGHDCLLIQRITPQRRIIPSCQFLILLAGKNKHI